jgi:hypothetical protein
VHWSLCLGQVTYGFDTAPTFIAKCHGPDCKRASGGEMATFAALPDTDFTALSRRTKRFSYGPNTETCAGKGLARGFCTTCGSRVFTNNLKDSPGTVFVQEGTLDRLDELFAPKVEIFTWSRQKWARPLDLLQFDYGPRGRRATGGVRLLDDQAAYTEYSD